jgi:hypothetical protein
MKLFQHEGHRFHVRHLIILVVFFALFLGILTPVARNLGTRGLVNPRLLLLVGAPWLLGTLILVLGRKGPMKYWASPILLSLMAPALAICHDWLVVESWLGMRILPNLFVTFAINVGLIGAFTAFLVWMCPRRCPECRSLAMIPLRSFWGPAARTPRTRWCARCGAKYWRTRAGEWKRERRRTWIDPPAESVSDDGSIKRFDVDSRNLCARISEKSRHAVSANRASAGAGAGSDPASNACRTGCSEPALVAEPQIK